MKTIKQVLYAFESCLYGDLSKGCGNCPYKNIKSGNCKNVRNEDAFHYLERCKEMLNNDPLTMKEITRLKEGEALWIEGEASPGAGWYLYHGRHMTLMEFTQGTINDFHEVPCDHIQIVDHYGTTYVLHREDQGKRWNAYRYRRNK